VWLVQSAIPSVPPHAQLPAHAIANAAARLSDEHGVFQASLLARALERCQREQPDLAAWLENHLAKRMDDAARGLGASMALTVWMAFSSFAGSRLRRVQEGDIRNVEGLLHADEEIRRDDPRALVESDDVIAAQQPAVASMLRARLDETLARYARNIDVDDVDRMYEMVLAEVLVLSYAVEAWQPGSGSTTLQFC